MLLVKPYSVEWRRGKHLEQTVVIGWARDSTQTQTWSIHIETQANGAEYSSTCNLRSGNENIPGRREGRAHIRD